MHQTNYLQLVKCVYCGKEPVKDKVRVMAVLLCENCRKLVAKLQTENKRLKKKIKIVCVGIEAPKFDPAEDDTFKVDLTKPELAYLYGWESAILECGEILTKP